MCDVAEGTEQIGTRPRKAGKKREKVGLRKGKNGGKEREKGRGCGKIIFCAEPCGGERLLQTKLLIVVVVVRLGE